MFRRGGGNGFTSGLLEIPAVDDDDLIIPHSGYVVSYDASALIPEWVAYELTADELKGSSDRDDMMFRMDPDIHIRQAMREDYSESGWTKGHMACAADFRWDPDAMEETFYLTNICPQREELNTGDWNYLEKKVRSWVKRYGKVWVVCGPIVGSGKYGKTGEYQVFYFQERYEFEFCPGCVSLFYNISDFYFDDEHWPTPMTVRLVLMW